MSFIGIAINIWVDTFGTGGGGGSIPPRAILDAQNNPILDAAGNYILDAN